MIGGRVGQLVAMLCIGIDLFVSLSSSHVSSSFTYTERVCVRAGIECQSAP